MIVDGVPYDLTERQVYEVGQQVAAALVSLLRFAHFFCFLFDCNTSSHLT